MSETFDIKRGIRQGCPVSSLIFILCMEVLAGKIKQCNDIQGIKLKFQQQTKHVKLVQYADDGTLFLKNAHEMEKAIEILEHFGCHAGTKLNLDKCEGLWLGKSKTGQMKCKLLGIR